MLNFHSPLLLLQVVPPLSLFARSVICLKILSHFSRCQRLIRCAQRSQRVRPDCSFWLTLSQVCANQGEDINRLGLRLFPWRRISAPSSSFSPTSAFLSSSRDLCDSVSAVSLFSCTFTLSSLTPGALWELAQGLQT